MRGYVENARTVELFESRFGGPLSGKQRGPWQNRFDRLRFARRPFQVWEMDLSSVEVRAGGLQEPRWKPNVSTPCLNSWNHNSPRSE